MADDPVKSTSDVSRVPATARSLLVRARPQWPLLLAVVLLAASLAGALRAAMASTDGRLVYALDDAYIHMAVGRNLATHGVWGCTPFHFSSSSSSLLWAAGLGAVWAALGVHDWTPLVLNVLFAIGTLVVVHVWLARFGASTLVSAVTLAGIVVAFPLAGMVLMGMEHILHLLLTVGFAAIAVESLARPEPEERRRRVTLVLCGLGALLAASRYEGFFLVGLVCLAFLLRRQLRRALAIGFASLLPVAVFGAISVANGSYFLPNPLMVKAVGDKASTLSALLKPFGSEDLAFLQNNRAMPILLGLALVAVLALWWKKRDVWRPSFLLAALLAGMILLHGHFVFSPLYWAYRYDAYLVGFGLFVAAVVLVELPGPRGLPRGALPAFLLAAMVPVLADVREGIVPDAETEGMEATYLEQYQTARFVQRYYPRAAVIVNDLGAVTYYTGARILDLVGLGDIEPLVIMRNGAYTSRQVVEWTAPYDPAIAVVSLGWGMAVPLVPAEWTRVAVVEMPPHGHRVGFYAVDPSESWPLRTSVAQYYTPLSRTRGHRVHLRPAGSLTAAIDRRGAARE